MLEMKVNVIKEAILVDDVLIWPIYQKVNWHQNSESVRTYIIDDLKCDFHISLDNFLNRYKNNLKEEEKNGLYKRQRCRR